MGRVVLFFQTSIEGSAPALCVLYRRMGRKGALHSLRARGAYGARGGARAHSLDEAFPLPEVQDVIIRTFAARNQSPKEA